MSSVFSMTNFLRQSPRDRHKLIVIRRQEKQAEAAAKAAKRKYRYDSSALCGSVTQVEAATCSEARALIKSILGLRRLPTGARVVEVDFF